MDRKQLKAQARAQMQGKLGILILITLIISLISGAAGAVLGFIPFVGPVIAAIIITPAFALSTVRVYLMVVRGTKPEVNAAFCGFDDFYSAFKVTFLVALYTWLWSLLFIIPGIVKSYAYSMAMYILADNKGKSAKECIAESCAMTNGHKAEIFWLQLSFIGWIFLAVLTLGILCIWLIPYISTTMANVYESLKAAPAEAKAEETEPSTAEA